MNRSSVWCNITLFFLLLVAACNSPNTRGEPFFSEDLGREITRMPLITETPSYTPTPITEKGKGELSLWYILSQTDALQNLTSSTVRGTIPFTIAHNAKKGVWEVKGSRLGAGTTEFNFSKPSKGYCSVTWMVELTLSGILAEKSLTVTRPGCWMQLYVNEEWKREDGFCSTHMGNISGSQENHFGNSYGPLKFELFEGEVINDMQGGPRWQSFTSWKIETLDVPAATGCMAGLRYAPFGE